MKVLLIKTPYLYLFRTVSENGYPLGLAYVASSLRAADFEVELLDPENQNMDLVAVKEKIHREKPEICGISCATMNFDKAKEFAQIAKDAGCYTILGGIHATAAYEEVIKNSPEFDFVVFGEAEETIVELGTALRDKKTNFKQVLGLVYREKNGKIVINQARPFIQDLDKLPPPQWDLIDLGVYSIPDFIYNGKKGVTLVTARGCPAKCIFCSVPLINGYAFRHFSAKRIVEDIEKLVTDFGIEFVAFRDDTFPVSRQRVVDICNLLINKNVGLRWYCLARVNMVDPELLSLMKKAGCEKIAYGVESADQKILNTLKKGINVEQIRYAFAWTRAAGIKPIGSFIFGSPGETKETMDRTINFAIELDPEIAHFFVMAPLPGTELYEQYKGIYFDENLAHRKSSYGVHSMTGESSFHCGDLRYVDLKKQLIKANARFYFRPKYIARKLKEIQKYSDVKVLVHNSFCLVKSLFALNRSSPLE